MREYLKQLLTWTLMSTMIFVTVPVANAQHTKFEENLKQLQAKKLQKQLTCLARNVYYESNGEPIEGQIAVAQVTLNRAKSNLFPNDLCAVITQSYYVEGDKVCQFSWYCDPKFDKTKVISKDNISYIVARKVLLEGEKIAKIGTDVFFFRRHDVHMHPSWPNKTIIRIGNHIFYKRER